jgi:opacity protein-like surface antigen
MKKLLTCFLLIFTAQITWAQETEDKEEKKRKVHRVDKGQIGIRSGLSYSFPHGNGFVRDRNRFAYHVGAYYQRPLSKKDKALLIEIGAFMSLKGYDNGRLVGDDLYVMAGAEPLKDQESYGKASTLKLTYIDVPIVIKDNQSEKFSPYGGIQFSSIIQSNFEYSHKEAGSNDFVNKEASSTSGYKTAELGIIMGMEYHVNHFLNVNLTYNYPLGVIDKKSVSEIKMHEIKLGIGFTF